MKEGSVGRPLMYLGANIHKWTVQDDNGQDVPCFVMGSHGYVTKSIQSVEKLMHTHSLLYISIRQQGGCTLFSYIAHCPEMGSTQYVDIQLITVYQNLIGMLQLICELGRVDIIHETTLIAQYIVQPRKGHL